MSRAIRGRTVLTTHGVYDRWPGFDSRNVAVNSPNTPSPAITFPITAIINFFLDGKTRRWSRVFRVTFAALDRRVQQTAPTSTPRVRRTAWWTVGAT